MLDAFCTQSDPEVFFPDRGHSPRDAKTDLRKACPVQALCLE